MRILLIHGPNLNLLGTREPDVYGSETLEDINAHLTALAARPENGPSELKSIQSNAEHEIVEAIHASKDNIDGIIINPAAFTHTSVAIRDALLGVSIPFYEVHLSNVHQRESFRHHSYLSDIAEGVICGLGSLGYECALKALLAKHAE